MLNTEEIKKVNDLYKQLDEKEIRINSLQNELNVATQTVNYLNKTIENNQTMIGELSKKTDNILALLVNNFKELHATLNLQNKKDEKVKKS